MKRKKILAVLCVLLAGVCIMEIAKAQTRVHGQDIVQESGTANSAEAIQNVAIPDGQEIRYESATTYDPNEVGTVSQSSHMYIPNP